MARWGYDRDNGQVYCDLTVPQHVYAAGSKGPAWVHESPTLPPGWERTNAMGAHTLKHMAMRELLSDQRRLTAAHLACMPEPLVEYLWHCLRRSGRATLHMWKLYAAANPQKLMQLAPINTFSTSKAMPTRDYFDLIRSDALNWGTLLTISTEYTSFPELVGIAKVTNLTALEIVGQPRMIGAHDESPVGMTDRILRNWNELAAAGKAFKHLRLLVLRFQTELTEKFFNFLDSFPSLVAVLAEGCPLLRRNSVPSAGARSGWKTRDVVSARKQLSPYLASLDRRKDESRDEAPSETNTLPLLELRLRSLTTFPFSSEEQRWFTRKQPQPVKAPPSNKRKGESPSSDNANPRRKRPALRTFSKSHMKKNVGLVQEYLGGPSPEC